MVWRRSIEGMPALLQAGARGAAQARRRRQRLRPMPGTNPDERPPAQIAPTPSEPKGLAPLAFKSAMTPAEVATLFQNLRARDGSTFSLDRIEPHGWPGGDGFRVEYSVARRTDDLRLQGVAWGVVRNGELFISSYSAPRLTYFARYRPRAEAIAKSARLKA
jgi:hypothetical protein